MGHQHFWERVDACFKARANSQILRKLKNFYKINKDIFKKLKIELGILDDSIHKNAQVKTGKQHITKLKELLNSFDDDLKELPNN